ncbi:MAG: asparagine--tRNA ligase, partial [Eubacteriaceae bacterium]|nr:asparagine--tRNA ligase [Eubacteriaceae bacterium]
MKYTVRELHKAAKSIGGTTVTVSGWIRNSRSSTNFGFIELNDGTFFRGVQLVLEKGALEDYDSIVRLGLYTALTAVGEFVVTEGAKQPFEIRVAGITVEAESGADYPIQNKRHTFEYLREAAYLRPRANTFSAVFRLRSILSFAIHRFFQEKGFVYVNTPIITSLDAEGAGELFRLTSLDMESPPRGEGGKIDYTKDFFGKESFLTVSGQLQGEAYALAFRKIYTFGPTFRAENSNTARHA